MGKTKTAFVGAEDQDKAKEAKRAKYAAKKAAKKVRVPGLGGGQRVVAVEAEPVAAKVAIEKKGETVSKTKVRGKNYLAAKSKIDPTRTYPLEEAVKLAKETSYSSFPGRLEVHLVLKKGTINKTIELPRSTGKTRKIEVASQETVKKLENGKIDFDVLIATAAMMPKLVPFAKVLGPRGLMPNPKAGTISEKPEETAKKFGGNTLQLKSETKAPLVHTAIGKINQPEEELTDNLAAVVLAVGKPNIGKAFIKATMGPSIKVAVS